MLNVTIKSFIVCVFVYFRFIYLFYKLKWCKYDDECFKNINVDIPNYEHSIDNMEDDNEDDWEPSPYCQKMNGAVGAANKNIRKII